MKYLIGIDLGTTNIKAVLFDLEGNELAVCNKPTELILSNGNWSEQDMNSVWEAAAYCLKGVVDSGVAKPEEIVALGFSGQGEGYWAIDADGNPVKAASLWNDGRAASSIAALSAEQSKVYTETTASVPGVSNSMMQLKWYKDNAPEFIDKAAHAFHAKDWVRYKLTGEIHTEVTDMSVSQLNIVTQTYAENVAEALGINEDHKRLYADPLNSADFAGKITAEAAAITGLKEGTPCAAGALDVTGTPVGVNAVQPGQVFCILGTTCCTGIVIDPNDVDLNKEALCVVAHPQAGLNIDIRATMAGTPNLDWCLAQISNTKDFAEIEKNLADIPAGSDGLIYLPYLTESGERCPFYAPNASASFFGISKKTTRWHMVKAVYEGIAFMIKDCLYGSSSTGAISLTGGGAKSAMWAQIIADVTGRECITFEGTEFGCKGVAILAGVAAGEFASIPEATAKLCKPKDSYKPNPENVKIYDGLYKLFRACRINYMDLWDMRADIMKDCKL